MKANLINIGNSKGLILPAYFIKNAQLKDEINIEIKGDTLIVKPLHKPRENWALACKKMHSNADDNLIIPDVFDDEKLNDWKW
jgi:antitoxin MazE